MVPAGLGLAIANVVGCALEAVQFGVVDSDEYNGSWCPKLPPQSEIEIVKPLVHAI